MRQFRTIPKVAIALSCTVSKALVIITSVQFCNVFLKLVGNSLYLPATAGYRRRKVCASSVRRKTEKLFIFRRRLLFFSTYFIETHQIRRLLYRGDGKLTWHYRGSNFPGRKAENDGRKDLVKKNHPDNRTILATTDDGICGDRINPNVIMIIYFFFQCNVLLSIIVYCYCIDQCGSIWVNFFW